MTIVRSISVAVLLWITAGTAYAQTVTTAPVAAPAPSATPAGFSGRAHLAITLPTSVAVTITARVAIAQRDALTRLSIVSVDTSFTPIRLGGITMLLDRAANTVTVWNDRSRMFYTQPLLPSMLGGAAARPMATTTPAAAMRPSKPIRSPLAGLDLMTLDVRLTGHTTTVGLPTTGLALDMKLRQHGSSAVNHVTGTVQLADDYAFFPATLLVRVQSPAMPPAGAVISYAVDAFTRDLPTLDMFAIPAGYTQAPALLDVVLGRTPRSRLAPAPTATETP